MSTLRLASAAAGLGLALGACAGEQALAPDTAQSVPGLAAVWGPETPPFNLQAVLHDPSGGGGFGLVRFRQSNDDELVITLDTWVRDLAPLTSYRLQRAVDGTLDGVCSSTGWLTLGAGLTPLAIVTDEAGTGTAELWRSVAAFPVGAAFDIHFQVIEDATGNVVLASDCYRFVISQ